MLNFSLWFCVMGVCAITKVLTITVNGEVREIGSGATILGLLALLRVSEGGIAVEVNREIVSRSRHSAHVLNDGDTVEILTFVGGG